MRAERFCGGCTQGEFSIVDRFAAIELARETEIVVWWCGGCRSESPVSEPVPASELLADIAVPTRRVA